MNIVKINEKEFISIINTYLDYIPIWSDIEAIECYNEKELIKVCKNDTILAVFLIPINNNGVRREYRYFPYCMPIILSISNNLSRKEIYKFIFKYIFDKYNYTFIPLHPDFKIISSISSQSGFVEMRHTHILEKKMELNNINSKLRNHINHAQKNVSIVIDNNYSDFDFNKAIKGNCEERQKRSKLAKKLLDHKKAFLVKAVYNNDIIAGIEIIYDKKWAYLLHSYQTKKIRGVVPLMIFKGIKDAFEKLNIKYFDFEGSVIDDIDDFFSSFDANVVSYPYIIQSKNKEKFMELIYRSINIDGRVDINETEYKNFK